ncbi:cilia- and flagella-associated protein 73-like [Symsagittifera roscoffensis]|uniref:cilia- and flagella-associated protein 73-like n=1 Tax=Symsagittifera roscoffensis TaxID=84072 RepID=UPI00307BD643
MLEDRLAQDDDLKHQMSYRLDCEPAPKGIFVTQLGNLYDAEEAQTGKDKNGRPLIQYPVVNENGENLLRSGVKTRQKTLLIREQKVVDKMNLELTEKRDIFEKRMESINKRKEILREKRDSLRSKIGNDQKYIQEQNAKRERAVEKFKTERKTNERLAIQQSELSKELDELKRRNRSLREEIHKKKPYNEFMMKVIDNLPDKFVESSENKVTALMSRYSTLEDANTDLVRKMGSLSDELSSEQKRLDSIKAKHAEEQLENMMELKRTREILERLRDRNQEKQQQLFFRKNRFREENQEKGQTLLSLRNLAEKCRFNFRTNKPIAIPIEDENDFDTMMYRIDNYFIDHKDIVQWSSPGGGSSIQKGQQS